MLTGVGVGQQAGNSPSNAATQAPHLVLDHAKAVANGKLMQMLK